MYRKAACGTNALFGLTHRIGKRLTAAEADEIPREFVGSRDVTQGVVWKMDTPMRPAARVVVACANYLHILGVVALIPSHNLQPFAEDDLIQMKIPQGSERIQLNPVCVVSSAVTIEVCIDLWRHRAALCDLAERRR